MEHAGSIDLWLQAAADRFGTPCYVYDLPAIEKRATRLRKAFDGRFSLSFAMKSNPNRELIAWLLDQVDTLDVSSIGELRTAMTAGWAAHRLSFTGPGKRQEEIVEALEYGVGELVVESVREAAIANGAALGQNRLQRVLIRLSPQTIPKGFGDHMAGRPSPFGIDVEDSEGAIRTIQAMPGLQVEGLHIYAGTQCLKAEALWENYRNFISIFEEVCERHDLVPSKLIFGSGLGIPYHVADCPVDLESLGQATIAGLDRLVASTRFAKTSFILELGRYLVGEAGYFVTQVVGTKMSRGTRIAVCDGGMNAHLAASGHFGMVIHRNYPMHKVGGHGPSEPVNLVGPLCTSIDRLANGVELPHLEPGDLIAVHSSGAYGPSASPTGFISHARPREILLDNAGLREVTTA